MKSKLDTLIDRIQNEEIPEPCEIPVYLTFTAPDNPIVPGTLNDSTQIIVCVN